MKVLNSKNTASVLITGIYKIRINEKDYIGSSCCIGNRLKHHIWSLKEGKHHNRTMQNLYNKYGSELVYFEVVELCSIDDLIIREKYHIDTIRPYMNHILNPQKIIRDDVYKQRLSEGGKKSYLNGRSPSGQKETHMYSLEGDYIKSFKNATEAAKEILGHNDPSSICATCTGNNHISARYRWSYDKLNKLPSLKRYFVNWKPILQYDLNNVLIKEWESITIAKDTLKISNIHRAAKKGLTAGGYRWKYRT